jgi:hypothetical protein
MGYLSPPLNEKLAGYHAADLRADADAHRRAREARAVLAAAPGGYGADHDGRHRFGRDRIQRWRERLAWALVGAGFNLLVGRVTRPGHGRVIPMTAHAPTGRPAVTPISSGCDGHA